LKDYGAVGVEKCFNCGNCTAICPLASTDYPFPRSVIRRIQIGRRNGLRERLDPWLCYYCGDCSETCPKGAEPGETMMAARRWLTAQYDWTGLARKFYTSKTWEIGAVFLLSAIVFLLFALFHGPVVTGHVALNTFAPAPLIEIADWIMLVGLSFFLLSNVYNMHRLTLGGRAPIPLKLYLTQAWQLIYQAATQEHFTKCDGGETVPLWRKPRWRNHWLLVSGYVLMFTLIVVFLRWFQTDNLYPLWHPQRWLGYYATVVLVYGAVDALWGRIVRDHQMHRYSHPSDWMFPILLLLTTLTGISVHTFRYLGLPLPTYWAYVAHLCILTPMLVLEVPFGKWSHLAYRPVAIYFQNLREKATQESVVPAGGLAVAD
ncbi:MAG: 4Fe-4S dicluster domain-containing protein, partial [Anaerolineales bacterium]